MTDALAREAGAGVYGMLRITGGPFRTNGVPVTKRPSRDFVVATNHVAFVEIAPDPKDYPGALPHMPRAGWLIGPPALPPAVPSPSRPWPCWLPLRPARARRPIPPLRASLPRKTTLP